jgi:spermidine synthase
VIPWKLLDSAQVPGGGEMRLYQRDQEFSIRIDGQELMNSRVYGSEDALADLACARIAGRQRPRILIGGLGVGYTLIATLRRVGADAEVVVAELMPAVVAWNRGPLSHLADHPLRDARVEVREIDVAEVLRAERRAYDAIMLDVDNGPEGLTRKGNDWLYGQAGLAASRSALRKGGVLAVWSASPDRRFVQQLHRAGLEVEEVGVRARPGTKGSRHTIWLAHDAGDGGR